MEAKNVIAYEYKNEERIYRLELPHGAPLGEAYMAVVEFLNEMVRMVNEHAKATEQKELAAESDDKMEEKE